MFGNYHTGERALHIIHDVVTSVIVNLYLDTLLSAGYLFGGKCKQYRLLNTCTE